MLGFFGAAKERALDAAIDMELNALHQKAKDELPADDRVRLYDSLLEIREAGLKAASINGLSGRQASRMMKQSAIAQIVSFIEIDRMFATRPPAAP